MSEDILKFFIVCRTSSGWKNKFKKALPTVDDFNVAGNKLKYPGWKVISFIENITTDYELIKARLVELASIGYSESYASLYDETTGEEVFYTVDNDILISSNSDKNIQKKYLEKGFDQNHKFFSTDTKFDDKLLIKLKPRTKGILKSLEAHCQNYIASPTDEIFDQLKLFIDKESETQIKKSKLTAVCDFPNVKPHSKAAVNRSPEGLSRELCYFYSNGGYAYLGYSRNDLSPFLNEECNFYYKEDVEHVAYLIEAFHFIVTSHEGKARTRKHKRKEAIFFNAGGSMYYKEQKMLPESVWGEIPSS